MNLLRISDFCNFQSLKKNMCAYENVKIDLTSNLFKYILMGKILLYIEVNDAFFLSCKSSN
jgi:hypothetical protein